MFVDSHCHLDRLDLTPYEGDLNAAIQAAKEQQVSRMLCIGIDMQNAQTVVDIAEAHEGIYASVGVHPLDIANGLANDDEIRRLALSKKVIAIGETGLDYYYSNESAELQQKSFRQHLRLSAELKKPVVVHTRDARKDTLTILREECDTDIAGVLHCFTESLEMALEALTMNFYISFSGIITFKNAEELREVVKQVPIERLLIETDSPYLAPVPYRGKKNEPKYVPEVAKCVAELKGLSVEEVAAITSKNFDQLFLA